MHPGNYKRLKVKVLFYQNHIKIGIKIEFIVEDNNEYLLLNYL